MPYWLRLPAEALPVLGEGCHRIFDVSLGDECDMEALSHGPAVRPCFPNLSKLEIACFGNRGDGERYVTMGEPALLQLNILSLLSTYIFSNHSDDY